MPLERPVRVLWLIKGLGLGGAERLLEHAAHFHDRDRFEIRCAYVLPHKNQLVSTLEKHGVQCFCLSDSSYQGEHDLRWLASLRRHLLEHPTDVLHLHSPVPGSWARLLTQTLPAASRPRLMTTEHNVWPQFKVPTRLINAATMPLDAEIYAVSDEARRSMWGPTTERAVTLVHGIDVSTVREAAATRSAIREELGLDADEFVACIVANLRPQKDYPNLLAAAKILADQQVPVRIVAVGRGELEDEIRAQRDSLGLSDRVHLAGFRPDAVNILGAADLFVLSSRHEGLPVALMEALALGVPAVCTRVGGIGEAITDGVEGFLVPRQDPAALAAAIRRVVEDPALHAQMSEAAAARAAQFDMRRAQRVLELAYTRLAASKPGAPRVTARPAIQIRPAAPSDRAQLLDLLALCFGPSTSDPRYADLFAWKHDRNAFGPSLIWVATDGDRLVGIRAIMRWEFEHNGKVLKAGRAVDTVTHPAYRGQGIFTRLTEHALAALPEHGIEFLFNTPNEKSLPGYLKMGWEPVGRLPAVMRLGGAPALLRTPRARTGATRWSAPMAERPAPDEAALRPFLSTPSPSGGLQTRRDLAYLSWRFAGGPIDYTVLHDARGAPAAIARLRGRGPATEAALLEFSSSASSRHEQAVVAARATNDLGADHALWLGQPSRRHGALALPGGGPLLVWRGLTASAVMPSLDQWSLSLGDIELF